MQLAKCRREGFRSFRDSHAKQVLGGRQQDVCCRLSGRPAEQLRDADVDAFNWVAVKELKLSYHHGYM